MRLNKKVQYGILFTLYIIRAGRVTIDAASDNLKLSKSFLEQVARLLRVKGVIKSIRGPNGGYEIEGEPTILDVVNALDPVKLLNADEIDTYAHGEHEHRALVQYAFTLNRGLMPLLRQKVKAVGIELVVQELVRLESAVATEKGN